MNCGPYSQVHQLLGELLPRDPDGGRYPRLLHQLLHGQEQERPRRLSLVRRTQGMIDIKSNQIYLIISIKKT